VLQCMAVCCSALQRVASCCSVMQCDTRSVLHTPPNTVSPCVAVYTFCYSVLQCVAVCGRVLQCVSVPCIVLQCAAVRHTLRSINAAKLSLSLFWFLILVAARGGGLGSRPKKMYGQRLEDGVERRKTLPLSLLVFINAAATSSRAF